MTQPDFTALANADRARVELSNDNFHVRPEDVEGEICGTNDAGELVVARDNHENGGVLIVKNYEHDDETILATKAYHGNVRPRDRGTTHTVESLEVTFDFE